MVMGQDGEIPAGESPPGGEGTGAVLRAQPWAGAVPPFPSCPKRGLRSPFASFCVGEAPCHRNIHGGGGKGELLQRAVCHEVRAKEGRTKTTTHYLGPTSTLI